MTIRKARIPDVKSIHKIINEFAQSMTLLSRSLNEIYENLRDYFVYEDHGQIQGICALHILSDDIAEIKSLVVLQRSQKKGIARELIKSCITEAGELGLIKVFALTYIPVFFQKCGFTLIDKSTLPHKIWGDCLRCPKFPDCDETAVIISV